MKLEAIIFTSYLETSIYRRDALKVSNLTVAIPFFFSRKGQNQIEKLTSWQNKVLMS